MDENKLIDADKLMAHFDGPGGHAVYGAGAVKAIISVIRAMPAVKSSGTKQAENISDLSPVDEFICSECGLTLRDYCRYDKEEDAYYGYELKYCPECGAYIGG